MIIELCKIGIWTLSAKYNQPDFFIEGYDRRNNKEYLYPFVRIENGKIIKVFGLSKKAEKVFIKKMIEHRQNLIERYREEIKKFTHERW